MSPPPANPCSIKLINSSAPLPSRAINSGANALAGKSVAIPLIIASPNLSPPGILLNAPATASNFLRVSSLCSFKKLCAITLFLAVICALSRSLTSWPVTLAIAFCCVKFSKIAPLNASIVVFLNCSAFILALRTSNSSARNSAISALVIVKPPAALAPILKFSTKLKNSLLPSLVLFAKPLITGVLVPIICPNSLSDSPTPANLLLMSIISLPKLSSPNLSSNLIDSPNDIAAPFAMPNAVAILPAFILLKNPDNAESNVVALFDSFFILL